MKLKLKNKYLRYANFVGIGLMLVGAFGFFLPSIFNFDMMNGGYAVYILSSFISLIGIISYIILMKNAFLFRKIANFTNVLCHWNIEESTFGELIDYESKEKVRKHNLMFWLIAVVSVIIGLLLLIFGLDPQIIILIILGLIFFVWFVSRLAIYVVKNKNRKIVGSIVIAEEGGIINGTLHNWSKLGAKLQNANIIKISENLNVLKVDYTVIQRTGVVSCVAFFPIPSDKMEEAKKIVEILNKL